MTGEWVELVLVLQLVVEGIRREARLVDRVLLRGLVRHRDSPFHHGRWTVSIAATPH
jgi:hypothetical protein